MANPLLGLAPSTTAVGLVLNSHLENIHVYICFTLQLPTPRSDQT